MSLRGQLAVVAIARRRIDTGRHHRRRFRCLVQLRGRVLFGRPLARFGDRIVRGLIFGGRVGHADRSIREHDRRRRRAAALLCRGLPHSGGRFGSGRVGRRCRGSRRRNRRGCRCSLGLSSEEAHLCNATVGALLKRAETPTLRGSDPSSAAGFDPSWPQPSVPTVPSCSLRPSHLSLGYGGTNVFHVKRGRSAHRRDHLMSPGAIAGAVAVDRIRIARAASRVLYGPGREHRSSRVPAYVSLPGSRLRTALTRRVESQRLEFGGPPMPLIENPARLTRPFHVKRAETSPP